MKDEGGEEKGGVLCDVYDTVLTACSVEACPAPTRSHLLVCGTYQLNKETEERTGGLSLHEVVLAGSETGGGEGDEPDHAGPRLHHHASLACEYGGVLDCKWCPASSSGAVTPLLACATSSGRLGLYSLVDGDGGGPGLSHVCGGEETDGSMGLSLAWSRDGGRMVASHDDGCLSLSTLEEGRLSLTDKWSAHSLYGSPIEVWIAAFSGDGALILSGGDDSAMRGWDARAGLTSPVFTNSKTHQAGVCSLQAHPTDSSLFVSGSYNARVRLWDLRRTASPVTEVDVGGGVWRLKWHPHRVGWLAAACMHGGAKLLRMTGRGASDDASSSASDDAPPRLLPVASYRGHESMTYGMDWLDWPPSSTPPPPSDSQELVGDGGGGGGRQQLVATCSFYDHVLHLWHDGGAMRGYDGR